VNVLLEKSAVVLLIATSVFALGFSVTVINTHKEILAAISLDNLAADLSNALHPEIPAKPLENPPSIIKSIYVTGWSAGSKGYLGYLSNLFKTTQINAVTIDVKDASGIVSYRTGAPLAKQYKAYFPEISNIDTLINALHAQGIYVIGRIAVFEDMTLAQQRPDLAIYDTSKTQDKSKPVQWQTNHGLLWLDPASSEVWNYNIAIAQDALNHGFDEINFDYVRFPSDGNSQTMGFPVWDLKTPRHVVIRNFFGALRSSLPNATLSADLFGQTTTNTDDMGIGQVFEDSLSTFNYVSPMVYPSHYANGFLGYSNPADHPYDIVRYAIDSAVTREKAHEQLAAKSTANSAIQQTNQPPALFAKIRPWLQDFNLGAYYTGPMVRQEITATAEATGNDFSGYMLWNPSNFYTTEAILSVSSRLQ